MRWILLFAFLLAWTGSIARADARIEAVEITDFGVYATFGREKVPAENTANGWVRPTTRVERIERTQSICAKLGLSFGVEFVIQGEPDGATVELEMVTRFPPAGIVNAHGKRFQENRFPWQQTIGRTSHRTFTFDEPWELVPGRWSLEFYKDGRKLGEQSFDVTIGCPIS